MVKIATLIPAAGYSLRWNMSDNKLFFPLGGKPILIQTLEVFQKCNLIENIVVIVREEDKSKWENLFKKYEISKIVDIVAGGKERQESVYNGLNRLGGDVEWVVIHDGARPFVTVQLIEASVREALFYKAVIAAVPVVDTIKRTNKEGWVVDTLDRTNLWEVQTPQTFSFSLIVEAYCKARKEGWGGTDDASLVERLGHPVKIILGSYENIKITTSEDLVFAETIVSQRIKG